MNRLVLSTFLLSSVFVAAIFAAGHFGEDELGDSDFDSDWFWIGSNLRSMGRPKLKITEHPDGYSMQIGYTGHYMRFRYTYSDHSLDFNIMDYKGSVQFRDEPEFEAKFTIAGGKDQKRDRYSWRPDMDATMKVKHSEGPGGVQNMELSFVNLFSEKGGDRLYMPGARMKDAEHLEAVIKVKINPSNFADSSMSFNMNAKGDIYQYISGNDYDSNWFPGNYNMTASVQPISILPPNPRQRQPKMTAALDLEEEITFDSDKNATNLPRSEKLLKKSLVIDCMINLTGKGSRLAVMKLTDAEDDKAIGRIQARREDDETMKLEFFMDGEQVAALNYFQNEAGMTNITMEDMQDPECMVDYDDEIPSFNSTSFNTTSLNTTKPFNETIENEIKGSTWDNCKTINRFLESFSGDGVYESRIYKDIFLMGDPPGYRKRATEGEKSLVFEEKITMTDDAYEGTIMFGGYERNTMHCKLNNSGEDTKIAMEMKNEYLDWQDDKYRIGSHEKLNLDITPSTKEEDDFNMKLSYNDDRIFDGWFYLTRLIQRAAKQQVPAMIQRTLDGFQESHAETTQYLSDFF